MASGARRPLVAGNWKMNGSLARAAELAGEVRARAAEPGGVDIAVCPPFVHLPVVAEQLAGSAIALGAQDASDRDSGAHTGEVAARMLAEIGCRYVIVGHSERRARHGETDAGVAAKFAAARRGGLVKLLAHRAATGEEHPCGHRRGLLPGRFEPAAGVRRRGASDDTRWPRYP